MPPNVLLTLLSALAGGAASAFNAGNVARQNKTRAQKAAEIRARLDETIGRLNNPDYSLVNSAASRSYTRAADAASANAAQRGVSGGGSARGQSNNIMAQALANLAQFKLQDQASRQAQIAGILGNEAYTVPNPESINPGLEALMGLLGGGAANAGTALMTILGNPELGGLTGNQNAPAPAPASNPGQGSFGVQYQMPTAGNPYGGLSSPLPQLGQSIAQPGSLNFLGLLNTPKPGSGFGGSNYRTSMGVN
jgi:hypothetical protein